jgi:O-antigen/teichoic acid export membrane protein
MPLQQYSERRTLTAVIWALAQNWGGKLVSLFIIAFLARHLTAAELGMAAAVGSTLALAELLAEQGYGDALVQKHVLKDLDLATVFYISLGSALLLMCTLMLLSGQIASWLQMPGLSPMVSVAAIYLPVAALGICQQALYRRELQYRWLALRFITATLACSDGQHRSPMPLNV